MALPNQVQAALDAADATLAAANAQAGVEPQEDAFAAAAPPPEPALQAEQPPEAAPEAPPTPAKEDPFEARYKVLQGKYNAEVPELHKRVHSLETNLQDAIARLNEASKAKEVAKEQAPAAADPKDVENFGSDLVDMVNRVASASIGQATRALEAKASALEAKIAAMTEQLKGTSQAVAVTAEQTFFDKLTKIVPDWEKVNANKDFLSWLAAADPVYGVPRQNALNMAQERLDADRAAAVFNAFIGPRQEKPKADPLESMVSPRGAATVAPAPTDKPVFTQGQITKFYDDVNKGRYRGNEPEVARIEALINAALSEGRIG